MLALIIVIKLCWLWLSVNGHGRLVEPPSRASMWRYGYNAPRNYEDNQLFCGGFDTQWRLNGGKCGICGDPWQGPRQHEAGGLFATGTLVRRYRPGSAMKVEVELTASHMGWFEFRLCPNNDVHKPATQKCLDKYLLKMWGGGPSRYKVAESSPGKHIIYLSLPESLRCSQCVFQWKYNAGNSWGRDNFGKGCVGCGPQEQFYGCSDITIGDYNVKHKYVPRRKPIFQPTSTYNNNWNPLPVTPNKDKYMPDGSSPFNPSGRYKPDKYYNNQWPRYNPDTLWNHKTKKLEHGRTEENIYKTNDFHATTRPSSSASTPVWRYLRTVIVLLAVTLVDQLSHM